MLTPEKHQQNLKSQAKSGQSMIPVSIHMVQHGEESKHMTDFIIFIILASPPQGSLPVTPSFLSSDANVCQLSGVNRWYFVGGRLILIKILLH